MEAPRLQQWIHNRIKSRVERDPEYSLRIGKKQAKEITRTDIEDYQLWRLQKTLKYVSERSPFYRDLFQSSGVRPEQISSLADLARIPLTNPEDLSRNPYRFLCVSLGEIARVFSFATSGTTAPKKKVFYSQRDLDEISDFMAACISATEAGGGPVQILLPRRSPLGQADLLARGIESSGRMPLLTGVVWSSEKQMETIDQFKPSVLVGSVSYIYRLSQDASSHYDLAEMGVKAIIPTSEYASEAMRARLQQLWGCQVRGHYGLTEMGLAVAQECSAQDGFHLNEADLLVEVIDPETGEILKHGEEGELVFTTLNREAMPLIRYRTHDICRLLPGRCSCGSVIKRMDKVTRRIESVVKLSDGSEIYPALFDDVLYLIPEVIDYQASLDRKDSQDQLTIRVEVTEAREETVRRVEQALLGLEPVQRNLAAGEIAGPEIEIVAPGALRKVSRAKKLILDRRYQSQELLEEISHKR